ncbi:hypothetical protein [Aminobacter sp. MSH1]|uniref:hypothetical protein n=1 Tax=Aminobacter sp. MSH1 TaxID=374606 RepID=UPI00131F3632|nr:hypothetical protein [Aminobacter sp. MSH1]
MTSKATQAFDGRVLYECLSSAQRKPFSRNHLVKMSSVNEAVDRMSAFAAFSSAAFTDGNMRMPSDAVRLSASSDTGITLAPRRDVDFMIGF